jgi:hypothetical protein
MNVQENLVLLYFCKRFNHNKFCFNNSRVVSEYYNTSLLCPNWNEFSIFKINTKFNSLAMSSLTRDFAVGDSGIIYTNMNFLVSLEELTKSYELSVYPNPASSYIQIKSEEIKRVSLFSMEGKIVLEQSPQSSTQTIIDLPYLPSGMYLLKVTHEDNTIQFKKIALHL